MLNPMKLERLLESSMRWIKCFSFVNWVRNHYIAMREEIVSCINPYGRRCGQQSLVNNMTTYTPQHVANFFLEKAESEGRFLDPMKLIKLVYIGYGWNLALKNERLFTEEIEAWKHGPVIQSIYHEFKEFRDRPITRRAYDLDLDTVEMYAPQIEEDDDETRLILDKVWNAYKRFSGWALRQKTHEAGTPWSRVYREDARNVVLKDEDIKEHFAEKIRGYIDAAKEIHERRAS